MIKSFFKRHKSADIIKSACAVPTFTPDKKKSEFSYFFFKYLLVFLIFCTLFIISYAIKWKVDLQEASTLIQELDSKNYLDYVVSRLSTSYYALMNYANLNLNYIDYLENITITYRNLIFRFDSLIGGIFDLSKPAINSINRLNYILINNEFIDDIRIFSRDNSIFFISIW